MNSPCAEKEIPPLNSSGQEDGLSRLSLGSNQEQKLVVAGPHSEHFLKLPGFSPAFKSLLETARHKSDYTLCVFLSPVTPEKFHVWFEDELSLSVPGGVVAYPKPPEKLNEDPQSFEELLAFITALDPKNVYLEVGRIHLSAELLAQCESLVGLVRNAKISLSLVTVEYCHHLLLRSTSSDIDFLLSSLNVLEAAGVVSSLNLEQYVHFGFLGEENLKVLMRYKVRSIYTGGFIFSLTPPGQDSGSEGCGLDGPHLTSSLRLLEIECFNEPYNRLPALFDFMKCYYPELRSFKIGLHFHDDQLCPKNSKPLNMDSITESLSAIHKIAKGWKAHCDHMCLSELEIKLTSSFKLPPSPTFNVVWFRKLKKDEGFKKMIQFERMSEWGVIVCHATFQYEDGPFALIHQVQIFY